MAKNKKTKAVKPIVKTADDKQPCPKGQVRNANGICVDDVG